MKKIKEIRLKQGLTQKQLSHRSGLSQSYINELENGRKANPSIIVLDKLSVGLQIPLIELLEGERRSIQEFSRSIDAW